MKIIFFGSSEFSVAALEACLRLGHEVVLVVTTPDQKKGRGLKVGPTPVKIFAQEKKLRVEAPVTLKNTALLEKIKKMAPELFVVSSYGKLIPAAWLKIPYVLALNVHPSLLPRYRGASPIQAALLNGDRETGVSIAEVINELDAGDVFAQRRLSIDPDVNAQDLSRQLAELSGKVLEEVLGPLKAGKSLTRRPQGDKDSSYASKLTKEQGRIDWSRSALQLHNQIRGFFPWPAASTKQGDVAVQILKSSWEAAESDQAVPGEIVEISPKGFLRVQTGKGRLQVDQVKPAGKRVMSGTDFATGRRLKPGAKFG